MTPKIADSCQIFRRFGLENYLIGKVNYQQIISITNPRIHKKYDLR